MAIKLNFKQKLLGLFIILAVIGPGIITANVDNDAGGIATYSLAGANFGYTLLWTLIPITILLIMTQEICSRLGVVTGKGLADLIRENFSIKITFTVIFLLVIVNITNTISEFAGIAAASEIFGVTRYIAVPLAGFFVWWIVLKGDYKRVEKIFLAACLLYLSYIVSGFLVKADWVSIAKNTFVPSIQFTKSYWIMIVGLIGTTIAPWMQFYIQSSLVEKGVRKKDYKYSKWDVIIGCIITDIVAFFIIFLTAATIFSAKLNIVDAADAAKALMPLAGKYAGYLFAFGLLNASLFAASILPLSTTYSVSEAFGWELGVNRKFKEAKRFYILYGVMILLGMFFVLIPNFSLVTLMFFSQVLNGILLPFIIILSLILVNKYDLMGEYKSSKIYNIILWICSIIIIMISLIMVYFLIF